MAKQPSAPEPSTPETETGSKSTSSVPATLPPERREEMANKLVDRFAIWAGAAGVLPIPLVDLIAVGGIQLQMLRRLSQIYDVPFSQNRGKSLIASLAGALIPTTSGIGAASVLKAVPVLGTALASFVMPILSAGATYGIGKVFIHHFKSVAPCLILTRRTIVSFLNVTKKPGRNGRQVLMHLPPAALTLRPVPHQRTPDETDRWRGPTKQDRAFPSNWPP